MADLLIPVGGHFFTPDALQRAVDAVALEHPGKSNVLAGTVDSAGAKVVLVLGTDDGTWKVRTAFEHDWSGNNTFGVTGSYAW